jgi:hypothetical protein
MATSVFVSAGGFAAASFADVAAGVVTCDGFAGALGCAEEDGPDGCGELLEGV